MPKTQKQKSISYIKQINLLIDIKILILALLNLVLFFAAFLLSFLFNNYRIALWNITIILFSLIASCALSIEDRRKLPLREVRILNLIILSSIAIISTMSVLCLDEFLDVKS